MMMRMLSPAVLALLLACGDAKQEGSPFIGGNNSARLTGGQLGRGTEPNNRARAIPLQLSGEGLSASTVYIARSSLTEPSAAKYDGVMIPITNTGAYRCFIKTDTLVISGASGVLATLSAYVTGSVGVAVDNGVYSDTCLETNQTGYLLTISRDANLLANATSATAAFSSPARTFKPALERVIPQSYSYQEYMESITLVNEGETPALFSTLGASNVAVVLDDEGLPAFYGYITGKRGLELAPKEPVVVTDYLYWTGQASQQLVFVDFVSPLASNSFRSSGN